MADTQMLGKRMDAMEATVARLVTAVDGIVDKVVSRVVDAVSDANCTPIVMTKGQLEAAIKAATHKTRNKDTCASPTPTPTPSSQERIYPLSWPATPTPPSPEALWKHTPSQPTRPAPVHCIEINASSPPALEVREPANNFPRFGAPPRVTQPVVVTRPPPLPQKMTAQVAPSVAAPPKKPAPAAQPEGDQDRLYLWGNAWRHLPEDYEFPKESLDIMWRLWCCGDSQKGYLPLKRIQSSDIASLNDRKRLSDLKFLMKYIEKDLQDRGVWKETPTELEADQMLRAASDYLPINSANGKGQKRDLQSLKWHSAVTLLRGAVNKKARCV